ncbi:hypothetical protein SNEBB_001282 [Seison nebaliae]|nr:hypothetical protein SNEBB_001282 [Seison nebaliae]
MDFIRLLTLTQLLLILSIKIVHTSDHEAALIKQLFKTYNSLIRPVKELNETIKIDFFISLLQIIHVFEKEQIMKTNVWLNMEWTDYQLKWKPEDFGNIQSIRVPSDRVWTPDIVLFNNADGNYEVSYKSNVVIYYYGAMLWVPPAIYKSSCYIDVKYFPFDEQVCEMRFGSWTFRAKQISFGKVKKVEVKDYHVSATWDLIEGPMNISINQHTQKEEIVYKIRIRRKTLFYTINLIIPSSLISFLSICVFYLPTVAGEKVTLCISILLALVVFLLMISKILPPTSIVIPLISKYLLFTFLVNIITIVVTVLLINWHYRTPRTHRMPVWIRWLFIQKLPKLLFMGPARSEKERSKAKEKKQLELRKARQRLEKSDSVRFRSHQQLSEDQVFDQDPIPKKLSRSNLSKTSLSSSCANLRQRLLPTLSRSSKNVQEDDGIFGSENETEFCQEQLVPDDDVPISKEALQAAKSVQFIAKHTKHEEDYETICEEWRYIASVFDRLMLGTFFLATIIGTLILLLHAPHIFEYVNQADVLKKMVQEALEESSGNVTSS